MSAWNASPDREEDLRHSEQLTPEQDEQRTREILDRVANKVLSHRPKPKTKAAKRRMRRKKRKAKRG